MRPGPARSVTSPKVAPKVAFSDVRLGVDEPMARAGTTRLTFEPPPWD